MNIRVRPATMDDEKILFEWRNDPTVLAQLSDSSKVPADAHHKWMKNYLNNNFVKLFIVERFNCPIGAGRIEWDLQADKGMVHRTCLLSYTIDNEWRGCGYGSQLVEFLVKTAREQEGYLHVSCRIKRGNLRSARAAIRGGVDSIKFFG